MSVRTLAACHASIEAEARHDKLRDWHKSEQARALIAAWRALDAVPHVDICHDESIAEVKRAMADDIDALRDDAIEAYAGEQPMPTYDDAVDDAASDAWNDRDDEARQIARSASVVLTGWDNWAFEARS